MRAQLTRFGGLLVVRQFRDEHNGTLSWSHGLTTCALIFPTEVGRLSRWSATAFPHTNRTYDILSNLPNDAVYEPASKFGFTL
jgi:hypothetical protein